MLTTLLFTDVVGSTERVAAIGDRAWRTVLDRHDDAVRHQLRRFAGCEEKLIGDGMLATFDGPPTRSVAARRSATPPARSVSTSGWGSTPARLSDAAPRLLASRSTSRIACAQAAQPSEVLVTRTVVDLVAGSGISFNDRGEHTLKGIPTAWQLFVVTT